MTLCTRKLKRQYRGFRNYKAKKKCRPVDSQTLTLYYLDWKLLKKDNMVMLIDDDRDDCDIFCDAASQVSDCRCHCVHNPAEALTILRRTTTLPDCIFLDINMPGIDGFHVLKHIKSDPKLARIPIVMYSTTPNPQEAERSLLLGADRFMRKTPDYKKLVTSLREIKSELLDPKRED